MNAIAKKSTARKGNPREASRGAAVERAREALGDAIDRKIEFDYEAAELRILSLLTGIPATDARERLASANLGELQKWTEIVNASTHKFRVEQP